MQNPPVIVQYNVPKGLHGGQNGDALPTVSPYMESGSPSAQVHTFKRRRFKYCVIKIFKNCW